MKKMKFIVASLVACVGITAQAQEAKDAEPKGKAIVQVFSNFNADFSKEAESLGFELERSYLGYEYKLDGGLTVKGVMDIGKSSDVSDYQRMAYIKNAMLSWKTGNLTLNGGLISTTQFNFQEKFWGYRYVMKSFQDLYKFGSSADLGISAAYRFADWLSADAIIVNGEGYKKIQKGTGLNYGLGATVTPVEGLQVRLYGGLNEGATSADADQWNAATFVGYKGKDFSVGAEYNYMDKAGNVQSGYSVYTSVNVSKAAAVYARWDELFAGNTATIDPLRPSGSSPLKRDSAAAIVGAQFKLGKYVKVAPNVRMQLDRATGKDTYEGYVSCYFGL